MISVILPTFNPKPDWLINAIDSVIAQSYIDWELCIADDASTDPEIQKILRTYSLNDCRIKVIYRETNGHISESSNSALELATGEWIALMDHDDILASNALLEVSRIIQCSSNVRLIYSDEDKIDESGKRFGAYRKCHWNRDLFYSHNMISHFAVYHAPTIRKLGGFRKGLEGSQDYDLSLRFIEQIDDDQIYHIPQVLYHWRAHPQSTALTWQVKPYVIAAGERAINDHLERIGARGSCSHDGAASYRVQYAMPENKISLTAIIFSTGNLKALQATLDQIKRDKVAACVEILVCPMTADIGTKLQECILDKGIAVIQHERGEDLSSLLNRVVKNSLGDFLWFLHEGIEEKNGGELQELLSHAARPSIGAVGGILLYPGGRVRQAGLLLDTNRISHPAFHHFPGDGRGYMGRLTLIQNYSAVSLDCMVIEKRKFLEVAGFDDAHLKAHHLDVDLCLHLKDAGYRTLWTPYARFTDWRTRFVLKDIFKKFMCGYQSDSCYMQNRWGTLLKNDPAYSPKLRQKKKDFSN